MMASMMGVLTLVSLLSLLTPSQSVVLCDGVCLNSTNLEICRAPPPGKFQLDLMAFFPCNVEGFRARGLSVAAQMAANKIANNSSVLTNYTLNLVHDNTMCDRLVAVRAFIKQLQDGQRYMIIGPGCSIGTALTAETAPFYSLTQIGYTATSITLSSKNRFPTFLRAISSDNASIAIFRAIVKEFGWQQVAIIGIRDALFSNLTAVQSSVLQEDDVHVITQGLVFDSKPTVEVLETIVNSLNVSGARVVLLNVYEDHARNIFCLAYRRGMISPQYTFISYYWYSSGWWMDDNNSTDCTVQELTDAIFSSVAVDHFPAPSAEERLQPTDVGYDSPDEFWQEFESNILSLGYARNEALRQAAYVYDAVWTAAFALHNASTQLEQGAVLGASKLEDFDHFGNETLAREINQIIFKAAIHAEFRGVSGGVKFNEFGDREPSNKVYQYLYTEPINTDTDNLADEPFATIDESTGKLKYFLNNNVTTVFPAGVTLEVQEITIHIALFIVYTLLSFVGVIFSIVCIIFNLTFRKKRIVKLSSPYLNVVILFGAILFYLDVIMLGLDTNFAPLEVVDILRCQFSIWLASIAFSLFFGTMLAKTWRVYYIFKNIRLKKKPLKDWILFLIVLAIVAVDVLFLIVVSVDIFRLKLQPEPLQIQQNGEIPLFIRRCKSDSSVYWIPILLGYKALYLLIGIFLAAQTYNVKLKRLRDSKLIVACVASICVVAVVTAVVAFSINIPSTSYAVYGFFIIAVITAILIILFGTLMIELWKNPSGDIDVTLSKETTSAGYLDNTTKLSTNDQSKINTLKATIQSLKEEIALKQNSMSPDHMGEVNSTGRVPGHQGDLTKTDPTVEGSDLNQLELQVIDQPTDP